MCGVGKIKEIDMPHCILEYTEKNVKKEYLLSFFRELHGLLTETKEFNLEAIKSRAKLLDCFYMGNGDNKNNFFTLTVSILTGRSMAFKQQVSKNVLELMKKFFKKEQGTGGFSLSVNIVDIERDIYQKYYEE